MLDAFRSANAFLRVLYKSGLWLSQDRCRAAAQAGLDFIRSYLEIAAMAHEAERTRFKLTPKLHAMIHITDHMVSGLERGLRWTLNPLSESVQMDEDLVGKVSSITCTVSTRQVHLQTIRKYLTNLWSHLRGTSCS